jgi:CheY-like chemotaxis protein
MPISPLGLLDRVMHARAPQLTPALALLPLQALTVLAVEDSRFASDALRLLCQRSGARLRRVETLQAAYSHLRVYRPDVMLIDMGLPDGRGDTLIRDLARHRPQGPVVIAISGDPDAAAEAMAAGAHGFIEKPFPTLAAFQAEILRHLPDRADCGTAAIADTAFTPDPLALHDDLQHAAGLVQANPNPQQRRYLAGFVTGIARSANDPALAAAAQALADANGLDGLGYLLAARINGTKSAFGGNTP